MDTLSKPKQTMENEYCYLLSVKIIENMRKTGLINDDEYHKIDLLNRTSFSPKLAPIMG
ncbi:MAG: hypothetical protein GX663_01030 [Clostridiales bacterium]|nr:hypothetical protein [Clostridiales bacterium]